MMCFSPVYGTPIDIADYLGQIKRNSSGQIVAAEAAKSLYYLEIKGALDVEVSKIF